MAFDPVHLEVLPLARWALPSALQIKDEGPGLLIPLRWGRSHALPPAPVLTHCVLPMRLTRPSCDSLSLFSLLIL